VRVAILTISDAGACGERVDATGDAAERWAVTRGDSIAARTLVPDETTDGLISPGWRRPGSSPKGYDSARTAVAGSSRRSWIISRG